MPKFDVRIDVRFNLTVEADSEDEARQIAEDEFDPGNDAFEIMETLTFERN